MYSILQLIERRRLPKHFKHNAIPDTLLNALVDAVAETYSHNNWQPWQVVVITAEESKKDLIPAFSSTEVYFSKEAAALFVFTTQNESQVRELAIKDVMTAAAQLVLVAESFGLGSRFLYEWQQDTIKKIIGADAKKDVVAILAVGYVAETEKNPDRLPRKQLFFHNYFQTPYQFRPQSLRSPREKGMGLVHLPRLIDKIRLAEKNHLPGYNYITVGFDKLLLDLLGVKPEDFIQKIKTTIQDDVIYQWLEKRANPLSQAEKEAFNEKLLAIGPSDPARAERFNYLLNATDPSRKDVKSFMELIDLMEGRI